MSQKAPFWRQQQGLLAANGNALDRPGMGDKVPQDFCRGP